MGKAMGLDALALAVSLVTAAATDEGDGLDLDLSATEVGDALDGLIRLNLLLVHRIAFLEDDPPGDVLRRLALHIARVN
jgi:hypothetical protein